MKRKNAESIMNPIIEAVMPIASTGLTKREAALQKTMVNEALGFLYSRLLKKPDPSPEEVEDIKAKALIEARNVMKELVRTLPHSLGGRRRKLTTEESRKFGQQIDDLVYDGIVRSYAKQRARHVSALGQCSALTKNTER